MDKHWTEETNKDFTFSVAMDFVTALDAIMEERGITLEALAGMLHVSERRIEQICRNQVDLTMRLMGAWSRTLKIKMALIAECWEALGRPTNQWEMDAALRRIAPEKDNEKDDHTNH